MALPRQLPRGLSLSAARLPMTAGSGARVLLAYGDPETRRQLLAEATFSERTLAEVAARLGVSRPVLLAMIVGALSLAGGIANAVMLSPPAWTLIEMPLYLVVAWLAGKQVEKSRAGAAD